MIRNLTAHPVVVYPDTAPDVITLGDVAPVWVIDRDDNYQPARVRHERVTEGGAGYVQAPTGGVRVPVDDVAYYPTNVVVLPEPGDSDDLYLVPMLVGLAAAGRRNDLLVCHREVRNRRGHIIGCRGFARVSIATDNPSMTPAYVAGTGD